MTRSRRPRAIGGWYEATSQPRFSAAGAILSAAAHIVLVGMFIDASGPPAHDEVERNFRPVFYLPPPNRPVSELGSGERLEYVMVASRGTGADVIGSASPDGDRAEPAVPDPLSGGDQTTAATAASAREEEPVFTIVEVDEEAVRVANSAAPAYPPQMLAAGIEGVVVVRYIVDAEGAADVNTLVVVSASRREFADAVRQALPYMRFTPARIDNRPVRQLVEQPFSFRIQRVVDTAATETAKNTR